MWPYATSSADELMKWLLRIALLLAPLTELAAQEVSSIEPGTRVRITAPSFAAGRLTGKLIAVDADTFTILVLQRVESGEIWERLFAIPREAIIKFEVRSGRTIVGE